MYASILQIANSMATIARDGVYVSPALVAIPEVKNDTQRIATIDNCKIVQDAMRGVIYQADGTAYDAFLTFPWSPDQVEVFGKTGSTDYSLFSCYAKANDGRCLAIAVIAETEAHGNEVAAPLASEIILACSELNYLPEANQSIVDIDN